MLFYYVVVVLEILVAVLWMRKKGNTTLDQRKAVRWLILAMFIAVPLITTLIFHQYNTDPKYKAEWRNRPKEVSKEDNEDDRSMPEAVAEENNEPAMYYIAPEEEGILADLVKITDHIESCEASSELNGKGYFGAGNLFDEKDNTSWQEGEEGFGVDSYVDIYLTEPMKLTGFAILNGNCKSEDAYYNNGRAACLVVTAWREDGTELSVEGILEDNPDWKNYMLQGFEDIVQVRFTYTEVYEGVRYQDTCISELALYGYSE